jgi:hypothetical protein
VLSNPVSSTRSGITTPVAVCISASSERSLLEFRYCPEEPMHIGHAVFMEIADAGIDLWFYESRTKFEAGTFEADVIGAMKRASSFKYRRDIAAWTTAAYIEK